MPIPSEIQTETLPALPYSRRGATSHISGNATYRALSVVVLESSQLHGSFNGEGWQEPCVGAGGRVYREGSRNAAVSLGLFQGAVLIPWSFALISSSVWGLRQPNHWPRYQMTIELLMGLLGLPLAYGLLRKKLFAFALVYAMFGLVLLVAAVRLPTVISHFTYTSEKVSGSVDAGLLLIWLLSVLYYRRRKCQFH